MNRFVLTSLLTLTIGTTAIAQNSPASKIAAQKGWLTDLNTARAQALKTGKPIMLVFRCDP